MAKNTHIEELIRWALDNGSLLNPSVEVYEDQVTGLSFRAKQNITDSTVLAECAYPTTLSYLNGIDAIPSFSSHGSTRFPIFFRDLSMTEPHIISHFFLIQQYLLGEKSFWWPYIRLLPQPDEPERLGIPILWPEEDQRFLDGTNAEPSIKKRRELWESEWEKGISLLGTGFPDCEQYTYLLYQWAASIFGSRSFRPSLTISDPTLQEELYSRYGGFVTHNIRTDKFSILAPLLDIGNHNGVNLVHWSCGTNSFKLSSQGTILEGSQIYNFYGDKSNSELLLAYGFTLDDVMVDRLNLAVVPHAPLVSLRRIQASHIRIPDQSVESVKKEFMYYVQHRKDGLPSDNQISTVASPSPSTSKSFNFLSQGLFDTLACMLANPRERRYSIDNECYSPEQDAHVFEGALSRSAYRASVLLKTKLTYDITRLEQARPSTSPQNSNQKIASDYRERQLAILNAALPSILQNIQYASEKFLTLQSAFQLLQKYSPGLSHMIEANIAEYQEEFVPLNWDILIEDWDHTYWIVWIYTILSIARSDATSLQTSYPILLKWVTSIEELEERKSAKLYAETSEEEAIGFTVDAVAKHFGHDESQRKRTLNFASFVAKQETVRGFYDDDSRVEQDLLCVVGLEP